MKTNLKITLWVCLSLVSLLSTACANVAVYEREFLADPIMSLSEGQMSDAFDQHMHRALSQGLIGVPVGAGGCGCEQ